MMIALHKNARTTPAVRAEIAASNEMEFPLSHGRLSAEEFSAVTVVFSTGDCPDCALICSNSLGAR